MPGAQPRRPFVTRIASTARRGANVPNGVPGVYRVPRTVPQVAASDTGSAAPTVAWIQPDDVLATASLSSTRVSSRGSDVVSDPDFPTSLGQAYDGWDTPLSQFTSNTSYAGAGDGTAYPCAFAQVMFTTVTFTYPPVSPTPPAGMTVEYEHPAGVPIEDATFNGTCKINTTGESDGYGASLRSVPVGTAAAWKTSSELAALTSLVDIPWAAPVAGVRPNINYSFTFTEDEIEFITAWDVITARFIFSAAIYGGNMTNSALSATRMYRPPRYRFV